MRKIFLGLLLFSFILASGEQVELNRDVRTVYLGQEFTVTLSLPDAEKYPDYFYDTVDPVLNTQYVEFIKKEAVSKTGGLDPKPAKNIYYFKAIKRGETNINIYRRKIGKNSTTGLEFSMLVKIEK